MTSDFNEQRLNEGGPEAIRPEETLQGMSDDAIRTELFDTLEDMGVMVPPSSTTVQESPSIISSTPPSSECIVSSVGVSVGMITTRMLGSA